MKDNYIVDLSNVYDYTDKNYSNVYNNTFNNQKNYTQPFTFKDNNIYSILDNDIFSSNLYKNYKN